MYQQFQVQKKVEMTTLYMIKDLERIQTRAKRRKGADCKQHLSKFFFCVLFQHWRTKSSNYKSHNAHRAEASWEMLALLFLGGFRVENMCTAHPTVLRTLSTGCSPAEWSCCWTSPPPAKHRWGINYTTMQIYSELFFGPHLSRHKLLTVIRSLYVLKELEGTKYSSSMPLADLRS